MASEIIKFQDVPTKSKRYIPVFVDALYPFKSFKNNNIFLNVDVTENIIVLEVAV